MRDSDAHAEAQARQRRRMAFVLAGAALFMTGMAFAAVPLYGLICRVTGMGGTTQRVEKGSDRVLDQTVTVRFDANISPKLGWRFAPAVREVTLRIGETKLAFYKVTSVAASDTTGTATFNVTPEIAGRYFNKIECFCFQEQSLRPGESAELPVSFYIDPAILDDPDAKGVREITLSYTFFPSAAAGRPAKVGAGDPAAPAPEARRQSAKEASATVE